MLRQIIKAKRGKQNLIFLEENMDHVISEGVSAYYLQRSYNFKDKKIFDHELTVEEDLRNMDPDYENKLNAIFRDSKEYREIQISDAICGFVGRLYRFLMKNDAVGITKFITGLADDSESLRTLKVFYSLVDKSDRASSKACFCKTAPLFVENPTVQMGGR